MAEILYVEDEQYLMEGFIEALKDDHQVAVAKDGEDAIGRLKDSDHGFDLVILDIMLPPGNHDPPAIESDVKRDEMGLEVLRQLREKDNKTPVVVLTARSDNSVRDEAVNRYGVVRYFTKPTALEELLEAVEQALA